MVYLGALRGNLDTTSSIQILAGNRVGVSGNLRRIASGDDLPAVYAGPRPNVDNKIGSLDRIFVVFDDDNSIAEITQVSQGF